MGKYLHAWFDISENMWLDEKSIIAGTRFLANEKFSALCFAEFDVIVNLVELDFGDLWALVCILMKWITDFIRLRELCEFLCELILDFLMDVDSRGGAAHLSLIIEPTISD
jgi:hypothetical protein